MRNVSCLHWRPFCCYCSGKQQKYTFNYTVNVEIMLKMFENINKSNFIAKYPKENTYRIFKNRIVSLPCPYKAKVSRSRE